MNYSTVEAKVRAVLAERLSIDPSRINRDSLLVEELGMDPFGSSGTALELQERFNIDIPDENITRARVFRNIVDCVAGRVMADFQ